METDEDSQTFFRQADARVVIPHFQSALGVWQSTIGVWQSTIGVWQSANGVWQRSLAKCSAQGPISPGVSLTFSNLFAIPPGPPLTFEVAHGAAGASVELQGV